MIRAEELRLGNYILLLNAVEKVTAIRKKMVETAIADVYHKDLRGVRLTEEWLLRFGFEKRVDPPVAPIWDEDISYEYDGYRFSEDVYGKWFLLGYSWNTKHFSYVHQLQNLYFALSGEELSLSEAKQEKI